MVKIEYKYQDMTEFKVLELPDEYLNPNPDNFLVEYSTKEEAIACLKKYIFSLYKKGCKVIKTDKSGIFSILLDEIGDQFPSRLLDVEIKFSGSEEPSTHGQWAIGLQESLRCTEL